MPVPYYYRYVKTIISGVYSYGEKLPSKRTVAAETGVSLITVEHALDLLCEEGYVEGRQRSGYYVIYRKDDFISDIRAQNRFVSENHNRLHTDTDSMISYPVVARTMRKVLLDYGDGIFERSHNQGLEELRAEISRYLARSRGIFVRQDQIVIGSGAEHLYGLIAQMLGTADSYAIEDPSYEKIRMVYTSMGVAVDPLRLTPDGIATEELSATDARILHVTPFHSFPSGITASISKKHEYLRWARDRNGVLIEDNYDSELTVSRKPEEPLFSMSDRADVIYLNTFSKTLAPSIRIGYMILPEHMISLFQEKLGFYSSTVSTFDQLVLAHLIGNGDFERHINRVRRKNRKNSGNRSG